MSGKSSPASKNHKSSRFSPFPNRSSLSRQPSPLPGDNTGRPDTPSHYADTHLAPPSLSHQPSVSSFSAHSTTNSMPTRPPPSHQHAAQHLDHSVWQNSSSTHLASPSPLQYPQGQTLAFQGSTGTLSGSHGFVMNYPVFVDHHPTADNFMERLLQHTIIGAEFDSSDRDPPPRCHPGTRLAIIKRCLDFITQCQDEGKLRWVVGPAGVGKSAVMQVVTEKAPDGVIFASVFLSVNGRRNGSKVILTIAYQLAVECGPYRQFIKDRINLDPSLLRKSLPVQFNKFIVEPFIHSRLFEPCRRFLIAIDGLDECDKFSTQEELLRLITDFCITHPASPIAWIVASRPEPHIMSFFDQDEVKQAYIKEEIKVDSDEACKEVEQYLRDELKKIKLKYPTLKHKREWPSEYEFTRIASSAGGLFAYAATVVRYIDDPKCRNPAAQLRRVLETIDGGTMDHIAGNDHPMAQLDALYKRILSDIPANTMINARKLLAMCYITDRVPFRELCNMLGLTEDDAYGAICCLQAVMLIPEPDKADEESLSYYHKSFEDFLRDSTRSGFSDNFLNEAIQVYVQASLRILGEVPYDGTASGDDISLGNLGSVKGYCGSIALSWPGDERFQTDNHQLRINLYSNIMDFISDYFPCDSRDGSISLFDALTTRFTVLGHGFSKNTVRDTAFGQFRHELMQLGKLNQVPLRELNYTAIFGTIHLQLTSRIATDAELSELWNSPCRRRAQIGGMQLRRGCPTRFSRYIRLDLPAEDNEYPDIPGFHELTLQQPHEQCYEDFDDDDCIDCSRRFAQHFNDNQDLHATVFVDGTRMSYVEFSFVHPDDGVSEWRYRFFHSGSPTSIAV